MKQENKDTSKISSMQKELDDLLESNITVNEEIKEKSKQIIELLAIRKKEDKGFNRAITLFGVLLILAIFSIVILVDKNSELQWYANQLSEFMTIQRDSVNNSTKLHYRTINGEKVTYDQLGTQKDSIEGDLLIKNAKLSQEKVKNESLSNELWKYKAALELSRKNYGLMMEYSEKKNKNGETIMTVRINSPKIDSAMIYYNYGKENLEIRWFNDGPLVRAKEKK